MCLVSGAVCAAQPGSVSILPGAVRGTERAEREGEGESEGGKRSRSGEREGGERAEEHAGAEGPAHTGEHTTGSRQPRETAV